MFARSVISKIGASLANPQTQAKVGDVARGISRVASLANKASGGLLKTAVEALPAGSLALKAGKYGLEHSEDIARFAGRAYQKMSSAPA
jgi:hypothetical protein